MLIKIVSLALLLIFIRSVYVFNTSSGWDTIGAVTLIQYVTAFTLLITGGLTIFVWTKESFFEALFPFVAFVTILLVVIFFFLSSFIESADQAKYQSERQATDQVELKNWQKNSVNISFASKGLGISFEHVSVTYGGKKVVVTEESNNILITLDEKLAATLTVLPKDSNLNLYDYIKKSFPECLVYYKSESRPGTHPDLPYLDSEEEKQMAKLKLVDFELEGVRSVCPFNSDYNFVGEELLYDTYYLVNKEYPGKYLLVRVSNPPIDIIHATNGSNLGKLFDETIQFIN